MLSMKKFKFAFIFLAILAFGSLTKVTADTVIGVSVFISNMFSTATSDTRTKTTNSIQYFEPIDVYNNRQGYVALLAGNGYGTDVLWHAFNKVNGHWDTESFTTQSQIIPGTYKLKFKTTGIYVGGTGITGWWTINS
jgi:hypothetical protein